MAMTPMATVTSSNAAVPATEPKKTRKRHSGRSICFWCLYLTIATVSSMALIEGLVRVLGLAPPLVRQYRSFVTDPYLPHKPKPLSYVADRSASDEFDFTYRHNSMSFRDVEHAVDKPPGVFRILGLGDSFTYGAGAPFEKTYLRRVEKMLNDRPGEHPHVEIIKAGISKFFPKAEKILLEHYGLPYKPDLVLVGFLPNDVIDTHHGLHAISVEMNGYLTTRYAHQLGDAAIWLYLHSQAARIVLRGYVKYRLRHGYGDYWPDVYRAQGQHENDWREVESQFEQINALAKSHDARVAIIHIPQSGPWELRHAYPGLRLASWAASHDVSFIDTFPALRAAPETLMLYWPKDGHCTPAGYQIIAQTIFDYLTQHNLVP